MLGRILIAIVGAIAALLGVGWLGLRVQSPAFSMDMQPRTATTTIPIPTGLPASAMRRPRAPHSVRR